MDQNEIMGEILDLNREIESRQEQINVLVKKNREIEDSDKDFDESIESYYIS